MGTFGFECIDTACCGKMKEQALALHDGEAAVRDNSAKGGLHGGGGSAVLHTVQLMLGANLLRYILHHCDLSVHNFAFRKRTYHVICATRQRELFKLVKEALRYNLSFYTTCVGSTLASLCIMPL